MRRGLWKEHCDERGRRAAEFSVDLWTGRPGVDSILHVWDLEESASTARHYEPRFQLVSGPIRGLHFGLLPPA